MNRRGQIAVGFLVIAAFTLLLVRITINLGQMAQVRTETSNAADAGALAAASWIASGENEAALIAGRMMDLAAMVQAIYIVPFCPGEGARAYADGLWLSLTVDPNLVRVGPISYLGDVADAAMIGAWNVGRREYFTAAVNNMMIRYATGPTGYETPGGVSVGLYGSVPNEIRRIQDSLYGKTNSAQQALAWNNGLPAIDPDTGLPNPKFLEHSAQFKTEDFPDDPPTLNMECNEYSKATYHQYREAFTSEVPPLPVYPEPIFQCDFVGVGITDTDATGPLVDITKAGVLPDNPLAVDAQGVKAWEKIPFRWGIPSFNPLYSTMEVSVGVCSDNVCGLAPPRRTRCTSMPLNILNGTHTFTVTVSHEVTTSGGLVGGGGWGAIPTWDPRFERVESRATAKYTAASTFPPNPNAKATLEDSR